MSCRSSVKSNPRRKEETVMRQQHSITVVVIQSSEGLCILIWL